VNRPSLGTVFLFAKDGVRCAASEKERPLANDKLDGPFDAALFDMDGTLVDTETVLYDAWCALAARDGADFRAFDYARIIGRPDLDCCRIVSEHFGLGHDPAAWHEEYKVIANAMLEKNLRLRPYASTILTALSVARVPLALVTSGTMDHVRRSLGRFGLIGLFRALVTADTPGLAVRKPDPAPYLMAARLLGVEPAKCIAFEDSPSGVRAARAAGCFVFGTPHAHSPAANLHEAHVVLGSLADFEVRMVRIP
jgi:pseudouridine-5'-monophosphatase